MKSFLEEYGFAILAAIVVILLIAMCTPVGNVIKTQVLNTVERFAGTADKKLASANDDEMSANIIGGTLYVSSPSTTDQYTVALHGTKAGSPYTIDLDDPNDGADKAVKSWNLNVSDFDAGSTYYAEVTNVGTGAVFTSNIVTKTDAATGNDDTEHNYLSVDDKYVGYYADVDGNNTIDGVIFFDYAHGATTDEGYLGTGVAVTAKTTGLANYTMADIDGKQVVQKVGGGDDRFYVFALEDTKPTSGDDTACWYKSLFPSADTSKTSTDFGTGKTNTATMKAIWDSGTPEQSNKDIWSNIPDGWFVLSKDEWSVLGSELDKVSTGYHMAITINAGASLSFHASYWSSSLYNSSNAWYAQFSSYRMNKGLIASSTGYYVRLASTF